MLQLYSAFFVRIATPTAPSLRRAGGRAGVTHRRQYAILSYQCTPWAQPEPASLPDQSAALTQQSPSVPYPLASSSWQLQVERPTSGAALDGGGADCHVGNLHCELVIGERSET